MGNVRKTGLISGMTVKAVSLEPFPELTFLEAQKAADRDDVCGLILTTLLRPRISGHVEVSALIPHS